MELVIRATCIYFFLLFLFIVIGRRQLAEVDSFRLVLLLIISEATQQALVNDDHSIVGAAVVIAVLVMLELMMSRLKARSKKVEKVMSGGPLIIVAEGRMLEDRMKRENIDQDDILSSAREQHGLESFSEIRYAILEDDGGISIIPAHQ